MLITTKKVTCTGRESRLVEEVEAASAAGESVNSETWSSSVSLARTVDAGIQCIELIVQRAQVHMP